MDDGRTMAEPVRLGEVLPEVMRNIEDRMETNKMNSTKNDKQCGWRFNRQINLSVLIQLLLLATLIVGSWVNLQRQLDLLQHDVTILLQCQKSFEQKLESLSAKSISYEYRLRALEKVSTRTDMSEKTF